jgi:hypothetical protein
MYRSLRISLGTTLPAGRGYGRWTMMLRL